VAGDYPQIAMIELNALPERTYGLVIGIERYLGGCRDVDGQVSDALKFAQWLCARGVPKENIHLCVSPLEENRYLIEQSELEVREATEQNIYYSITDFLSRKEGFLLYIFWAGHGVIAPDNSRRLVCADATKSNLQNQDFDSLLSFLRSDAFKIRHQICIVDACATYSSGGLTDLGGRRFSRGKQRKDSKQFVLFATREGETAKINSDEKTGYFSQVVREALLEAPNDRWPPDMEAITEKVKQKFEGLDKKQLPTSLYYQGWDGDKEISHPNPFDVPHNVEGFTPLTLIKDEDVEAQERETLSNEFYRGISARYKHILADVDKPRPNKLNEINQKFKENQIVIVHGASGQGKTTLAYRYLHDFFPDRQRFQVQVVESRQHALSIANALAGQAKATEMPIAVYLDVAPNDVGWDELVKQLSSHRNIQTIVTIREEDFRRTSISGAELRFSEVELRFDRPEAEEIYQFLVDTEKPTQFLDFDDAWNRFGSEGPLMEFVYLVTQGNSLREKLLQQVRQIEDEVRAGKRSASELKLLRLVSVASAFEARLNVKDLGRSLKLPAPQRTLEVMEKEYYLLRTTENGTLVGGLHPIRSEILASILTDSTFYPWSESATECLPFIVEHDISNFLLYGFSRYRTELEPLLNALDSYQPRRWVAIAGVVRALIWLGIKEYIETNQQLIADTHAVVSSGWQIVLNWDIADASPDALADIQSTLARFLPEDGLAQLEAFRSRQTEKSQVFVRASEWLSSLTQEPIPPQLELDWVGMAEALFWVGRLQVTLPIINWLSRIDLDGAVETLTLETLADVALGLFYGCEAGYRSWINKNYSRACHQFNQITEAAK